MAKRKQEIQATTAVRDLPAPPGFPTSVKIAGQTFAVVYRTPLIWPGGHSLYGMVSGDDRTILIDPMHPRFRIKETLLHEICHVYLRYSNLEEKISGKLLEELCDCFGAAICDLTENNDWPTR